MYASQNLDQIFTALSKAQSEMRGAKKDSKNPFFNSTYVDLASAIEAARDSLTRNGLSITQATKKDNEGELVVETILGHTSGQWICSEMPVIFGDSKNPAQALGSGLTYARRYSYMAMVGLAGEDDDGNSAGEKIQKPKETTDDIAKQAHDAAKKSLIKAVKAKGLDNKKASEILTDITKKPSTKECTVDELLMVENYIKEMNA